MHGEAPGIRGKGCRTRPLHGESCGCPSTGRRFPRNLRSVDAGCFNGIFPKKLLCSIARKGSGWNENRGTTPHGPLDLPGTSDSDNWHIDTTINRWTKGDRTHGRKTVYRGRRTIYHDKTTACEDGASGAHHWDHGRDCLTHTTWYPSPTWSPNSRKLQRPWGYRHQWYPPPTSWSGGGNNKMLRPNPLSSVREQKYPPRKIVLDVVCGAASHRL